MLASVLWEVLRRNYVDHRDALPFANVKRDRGQRFSTIEV